MSIKASTCFLSGVTKGSSPSVSSSVWNLFSALGCSSFWVAIVLALADDGWIWKLFSKQKKTNKQISRAQEATCVGPFKLLSEKWHQPWLSPAAETSPKLDSSLNVSLTHISVSTIHKKLLILVVVSSFLLSFLTEAELPWMPSQESCDSVVMATHWGCTGRGVT